MKVEINEITISLTPNEAGLIASILKSSDIISYGDAKKEKLLTAFEQITKRVPDHFNI